MNPQVPDTYPIPLVSNDPRTERARKTIIVDNKFMGLNVTIINSDSQEYILKFVDFIDEETSQGNVITYVKTPVDLPTHIKIYYGVGFNQSLDYPDFNEDVVIPIGDKENFQTEISLAGSQFNPDESYPYCGVGLINIDTQQVVSDIVLVGLPNRHHVGFRIEFE